jgi:hypothetical protein
MPKSNARPTSRPTSNPEVVQKPRSEWNDRAHVTLSRLFNQEQRRMEGDGLCECITAHVLLTLEFIDTHRSQLAYTPQFLRNEERVSASVFLYGVWRRAKRRAVKPPVGMSRQLTDFASVYFPNFIPLLRIEYLRMLRDATTANEIAQHGLTRLAAAYLEGAKDDAEREIRRLGGTLDLTIIDRRENRHDTTLALTNF